MMKRILLMVVAAAAISAPAMITPAAAANLDVNLSLPGLAAPVFAAPQPVYYAWGHPEYRRWEERRAFEREHFRHEEWRDHHYYR
jgi:hypothetical protein